jgi:hypothetical protein
MDCGHPTDIRFAALHVGKAGASCRPLVGARRNDRTATKCAWQTRDVADEGGAYEEATTTDAPHRLRAFSQHRDKKVRAAVALNPAAPTELLREPVRDKHHLVRYAVASRADRDACRIALAADDPDVRVILAQHPDLDDETWEALITDPTRPVRESLATSSRRPDVISRLSHDADQHVRACAVLNDVVPMRTSPDWRPTRPLRCAPPLPRRRSTARRRPAR